MNNGTYNISLLLTIADSYDLTIKLAGSNDIVKSPLTNKILVKTGLVQAKHTDLFSK